MANFSNFFSLPLIASGYEAIWDLVLTLELTVGRNGNEGLVFYLFRWCRSLDISQTHTRTNAHTAVDALPHVGLADDDDLWTVKCRLRWAKNIRWEAETMRENTLCVCQKE